MKPNNKPTTSKKYISLTFKITSFTTIIVLATSMIVAFIVYSVIDNFIMEAANTNINNETHLIANDIENSLIHISNDMIVLTKTPPIQGIIRSIYNSGTDKMGNSNLAMWQDRLSTIFESMLKVNRNYTQIRYIQIANGGKELVRVDQTNQGITRTHLSALQQKANRDYFQLGAKLSSGSIAFSKIDYNVEYGKIQRPLVLTIRTLAPVYTSKQKIFGIIVINVNISRYLRDILMRTTGKDNILLKDENGDFFIFNNKTKILRFIKKNDPLPNGLLGNKDIKSTKDILPYLKKDTNNITITRPIYTSHHKEQQIFSVIISVPKNTIKKQDFSLLVTIVFWVVLICLLGALLIFLFTRKTTARLSTMAQTIERSPRYSDKPLNLPIHLNDEVGMLARAFEQKTKMLNKLALYDGLTGLANRKKFIDELETCINQAKKQSQSAAIIYMDINKFKEVNDMYGHDHGDELLMQFANNLLKAKRENDFCARLGGDEFALIVKDFDSQEQLDSILNDYKQGLNQLYSIKAININVIIAAGVAIYPDDSLTIDELINLADKAMYVSKDIGNGDYCFSKDIKDSKE